MWACVSPASVGTLRITGATPLITSTGEWVGGLGWERVAIIFVYSVSPLVSGWVGNSRVATIL